jgi:hypothetical protein
MVNFYLEFDSNFCNESKVLATTTYYILLLLLLLLLRCW